ncbi:MAG: acylphosphatase [Bacteroidales bacterium]|nr:acylphosphatase [Bacteroidales bacterium]
MAGEIQGYGFRQFTFQRTKSISLQGKRGVL